MQEFSNRAKPIKLMIFDVDGILTDGSLYFTDSGEEIKAFNTLDGHGLKMLQATGVKLAVISGRKSRCVEKRMENLGITLLYQGIENKLQTYLKMVAELNLQPTQTGFMGDDLPDLPVMRRCGLAVSVPEAPEIIRKYAHLITKSSGGRGAVREACELLMQAQNTFESQMTKYLT
jgi:3-deoxy-D-manno-octulosonate 8-phosphate phosphatase (KDO 8-P phosphatase)